MRWHKQILGPQQVGVWKGIVNLSPKSRKGNPLGGP
jgi:hypothetical protein